MYGAAVCVLSRSVSSRVLPAVSEEQTLLCHIYRLVHKKAIYVQYGMKQCTERIACCSSKPNLYGNVIRH